MITIECMMDQFGDIFHLHELEVLYQYNFDMYSMIGQAMLVKLGMTTVYSGSLIRSELLNQWLPCLTACMIISSGVAPYSHTEVGELGQIISVYHSDTYSLPGNVQ